MPETEKTISLGIVPVSRICPTLQTLHIVRGQWSICGNCSGYFEMINSNLDLQPTVFILLLTMTSITYQFKDMTSGHVFLNYVWLKGRQVTSCLLCQSNLQLLKWECGYNGNIQIPRRTRVANVNLSSAVPQTVVITSWETGELITPGTELSDQCLNTYSELMVLLVLSIKASSLWVPFPPLLEQHQIHQSR